MAAGLSQKKNAFEKGMKLQEEDRLKTLGGRPLNGSQEEWVARWGDVGPGLGLFIFLC